MTAVAAGLDIRFEHVVSHVLWSTAGVTVTSNLATVTADSAIVTVPIGVLHLAGEATWTDDPATITAALLSGHRAASAVLNRTIPLVEVWDES